MGGTPLFSKGKVFYKDFDLKNAEGLHVPTPTTLISFDAVIEDAAARNHTFLEILKNEIKKANGVTATAPELRPINGPDALMLESC